MKEMGNREDEIRDAIWKILINNVEEVEDELYFIDIPCKDKDGCYRLHKDIVADIGNKYCDFLKFK
jgi:hypothetical protein